MIKLMIHSCKDRRKYVSEFLVPALLKSGYDEEDIFVYEDEGDGCLKSYIKAFKLSYQKGKMGDAMWHLQDDVLPRRDFYFHAEKALKDFLPGGIICGYGNKEFYYEGDFGYAKNGTEKFYSFPCIRIPNDTAYAFTCWFEQVAIKDPTLQKYIVHNKFVDYLFKLYLDTMPYFASEKGIFNYRPCLVEHVDEFVGGSTVNKGRGKPSKALIFGDDTALDDLCKWYKKENEK